MKSCSQALWLLLCMTRKQLQLFSSIKIATKKKVYLFDILMLGSMAFRNGLSSILENKEILKVNTPGGEHTWLFWCRRLPAGLVSPAGPSRLQRHRWLPDWSVWSEANQRL